MAATAPLLHPLFDDMQTPELRAALAVLAESGTDERGAIFTRREVVEFILDLAGYKASLPLHRKRLLEPSLGAGDFLLPAIERLVEAYKRFGMNDAEDFEALANSVRAVEIHPASVAAMQEVLDGVLREADFSIDERRRLVSAWLVQGDFLLSSLPSDFDFVVGNPPYVRQELIPDALLAEYRRRFVTMYDRADIYIPFIERSLSLLAPGGTLGFICADRWMKNRYGGPLRRLVAEKYRLKFYVDMVDTPAFLSDVIAYPAITVISKETGGATRVARRPIISAEVLSSLAIRLDDWGAHESPDVQQIPDVVQSDAPWVLESSKQVALLRRLEAEFQSIEDAGCRVGIGVATGADQVFIAPFDALDVEADRKIPLAMTRDILDGTVKWRGFGVLNPFADDGTLVRLADYPRFAAYLEAHGSAIKARHVSQKNPAAWYRTIDRITPSLTHRPKLLIPDIKGRAHVVFEEGKLYPHHNLYFIVSNEWNLMALRAVLLSSITRLFIATYSTKMRGGYLRFQAQYLRRIRVPIWSALSNSVQQALVDAGEGGNLVACDQAASLAYGLTDIEQASLHSS